MKGQREELKDMGVEIDEKMFTEEIKTPKEGEAKIFDTTLKRSYIIKSEKLNQLVADYERQERDAWAHAIKVLKFLRKKGIDLEPQLKTLSDFKEIIYRCLDSYQKLLEKMIESSTKKIRVFDQISGFVKFEEVAIASNNPTMLLPPGSPITILLFLPLSFIISLTSNLALRLNNSSKFESLIIVIIFLLIF